MKNLSETRTGEISILSSAILNSLFPIITILSYNNLAPVSSLAWATLISLFFFAVVSSVRSSWTNILKKEIFLPLVAATVIIGVAFYVLFFFGLKHTSAGNAGIITTFQILSTFLFFNIWRKEFIDKKHLLGAVFMFVSAVIILSPNFTSVRIGDFLILTAMCIAPLGNFFQKKLRTMINSEQILFFRTLIAAPILFLLAYFLGEPARLPTGTTWIFLLINGLILFGFNKILWIESIHRIGVTKSISLSSISPVFTLLFAFIILKDTPTFLQLAAIPPAILGTYFLTRPVIE